MNKILVSFILTSLAGLSTVIGYFIIFIKGDKNKLISFSLSFASGVMLTLSIIDLLPSAFSYLNNYNLFFKLLLISFFFILGIYMSSYISSLVEIENNSLKKVGIVSMIAIILHNIPEGIITFLVSGVSLNLGFKLAFAISLHNIPEGISIAIPIYYATNKKIKTFFIVLISSLSEIIGAILSYLFLKNIVNNFLLGIVFSLIAGIMSNISLSELLPESFKYKNSKLSYLGFTLGTIIMIISHVVI